MNSEEGQKVAEADLISTVHWVLHTELTLDRPVGEVWPVFKDMKAWYTEYTFEVISGPSYQAGLGLLEDQVLKLTSSKGLPRAPNSKDTAGPQHFIQKTIKVAPQKEIVAVLSGRAYDWRQYTSFYVWRMTETTTNTTIFVDSYGEAELVTPLPRGEVSGYQDTLTRNWHRSWSEAFVSLRKIMDADK